MQCLWRLCQGLPFTELLCAAELWGQPWLYVLGNDEKQLLNFRCSKRNEWGGIIHKILSVCVKIKVKIQRGKRFKDEPTAWKEKKKGRWINRRDHF